MMIAGVREAGARVLVVDLLVVAQALAAGRRGIAGNSQGRLAVPRILHTLMISERHHFPENELY